MARRLRLDRGPLLFMGPCRRERGFWLWWVARTSACNLVYVKALEFRIGWPPVRLTDWFEEV